MTSDTSASDFEDVFSVICDIAPDPALVTAESSLIGEGRLLDSMSLVEVCLALEDLASGQGFDFDWTSETALSRSKSMFRSVSALAQEFGRQRAAHAEGTAS